MTTESRQIAAQFTRLASHPFGFALPGRAADGRTLRHGDASADGDGMTVVVTDSVGRAKLEYRAVI